MKQPSTLLEAVRYFSNPDVCIEHVAMLRWPDGAICPTCGRVDVSYLETQKRWQCKSRHAKRQFSVKIGTIFEDSPLGLDKWLPAVWMIINAKNGVSSYEIARALGVSQKTAWFMDHRIRAAMEYGSFDKKLDSPVEADETYIGGKTREGKGRFTNKTAIVGVVADCCIAMDKKSASSKDSKKIINYSYVTQADYADPETTGSSHDNPLLTKPDIITQWIHSLFSAQSTFI